MIRKKGFIMKRNFDEYLKKKSCMECNNEGFLEYLDDIIVCKACGKVNFFPRTAENRIEFISQD